MVSLEHQLYLKKRKKEKFIIHFTQIAIALIFLFLWQLLADLNIINTFISSSPKDIIKTIINLNNSGDLWKHILITLYETIISFALGEIIGITIAIIFWWSPFISKVLDPYLTILNSLPKVALGPIIIIWAGASMNSIILMALMISVIITIINVYDGFKKTDVNKIKLLKSFGASKKQIFINVVFRENINIIVSSLKICISMSLIGVIMGEFLVSKSGLGYLIMYGSQVFNLNLVMSAIIILCIFASILYYLVSYIEKKLIKND